MKRLMLWLVAFAVLCCGTVWAQAQDIAGTWQGTLSIPGHDLRTVIKIAKEGAGYKSIFYSIDQKAQIPVTSTTLTGSTVKLSLQAIGGSYEAKLNPDGKSMTGTFTQGGQPIPLNLVSVSEADSWTIPEPPAKQKPMALDAKPVYEVATIKPGKPGAQGIGFVVRGRSFSMINTSVDNILTFAYGLQQKQISGGPAWTTDDKFDVDGNPGIEGQPNALQLRHMAQQLLKDRFALKFHYEKKEMSAYALTVAKSGNKMTKSESDNNLPGLGFPALGVLNVQNATMKDFSEFMQQLVLDRPVVDKTDLAGRWNFLLKWTPDDSQFTGMGIKVPPPTDTANAPPALFTAMPEQLGLRLDAVKTEVEVLVIDHIEKPTGN